MSGPTPEQIEEWRKQATALHKFSPERAARHAFALAYAAGVEQGKAEQRETDAAIAERHFIYGHSVAGPGFAAACAAKIRAADPAGGACAQQEAKG